MKSRGSVVSFWDICVYEMLRFRSKHRPLLVKNSCLTCPQHNAAFSICCVLLIFLGGWGVQWVQQNPKSCSEQCEKKVSRIQRQQRRESEGKAHEMDVSEDRSRGPTLTHWTDTLDINQWTVNGPFSCVCKCARVRSGNKGKSESNHDRGPTVAQQIIKKEFSSSCLFALVSRR